MTISVFYIVSVSSLLMYEFCPIFNTRTVLKKILILMAILLLTAYQQQIEGIIDEAIKAFPFI